MPTQTKENYLKALFFLDHKHDNITVTDLSKSMQVSTPTVNNMVKKLQSGGWVKYEKYKPLKLTAKGRKVAALIIRKHRLTEMFLVEKMGFGWEEVHDIAEEIEHVNSEQLFDRMDEMLGFPKADPHGSPIPDKSGHMLEPDYIKLSAAKAGTKARLRALDDSSMELLLYLNKKELELGMLLEIREIEPYDQSMTIGYPKHNNTILTREVCDKLLVEVV
ncbi:MAG: metal-dependent transcriptional regulator [Bacteroidota bacterium]